MDNDHAYTTTTYDKVSPVEFTYKMSAQEVEDFVKLRVSNNYLFSGRRNTSMWAWRAILKHMGLQHKMSHCQASKKWENMKKRYKDLKHPPDGVKVFPESWPHFKLMDDATEGRLEGNAPILKAVPTNGDFLPNSRAKKRKVSMFINSAGPLLEGGPEIEVSLNGDEDEEEGSEEMVGAMQEMENKRDMMESERQVLDREKQVMERERLVLLRERAVLDREVAALDRDRASLERERATIEREKAVLQRERAALERDRDAVSRERLALERERARQERMSAARGGAEEATEENHVDVTDRKERFLNLFEKLIENF
ncbi:uncharacterized protein si:dkeyp-38g8.5 [Centropristis striata]|uniref:uncharacterized protein si:dkeyp-38g8.5 n=1 Tax=Centropristis striata TaxID=184440 RepID=UPI0027E06C8F|nr:uncharacterized protein si:dkeyp-38g8.5 [Centropristis striata]